MVLKSLCTCILLSSGLATAYSDTITRIIERAKADGIDLEAFNFTKPALTEIDGLRNISASSLPDFSRTTRIDVHAHAIPQWYESILPKNAVPSLNGWSLQDQFSFMVNNSISHSIFSISTPGSMVYPGNETASIAIARLLNEYLGEVKRVFPQRFSFYAATPLPYVEAATKEVSYALTSLNASGVGLLTNHEGIYHGDPRFRPFFAALDKLNSTSLGSSSKVVFIHPTNPAFNPIDRYGPNQIEFYFETARNFRDMTNTQTLHNFTNLKYVIPHCGGAFPAVEERFLQYVPEMRDSSMEIYKSRVWWDTAGPTFPLQVQGLLGYGVPKTQLIYGSDYPLTVPTSYPKNAKAVADAEFLTDEEKATIFSGNAAKIFSNIS